MMVDMINVTSEEFLQDVTNILLDNKDNLPKGQIENLTKLLAGLVSYRRKFAPKYRKWGYFTQDFKFMCSAKKENVEAFVEHNAIFERASVRCYNKFFENNTFAEFKSLLITYVSRLPEEDEIEKLSKECAIAKLESIPISAQEKKPLPKSPLEIKSYLKDYIIGQEQAIDAVSCALYEYMIAPPETMNCINRVLLLSGPSGVGKTYLVQKAAACTDLKFIHIDASRIVTEGFKGRDTTDIEKEIKSQLGGETKKAVIFFDEIDKLLVSNKTSDGEDCNKLVQSQIMNLISGMYSDILKFNTESLFFILAGAFSFIRSEKKDNANKRGIGFNSTVSSEKESHKITIEEYISHGMIYELARRINKIVNLVPLTKEDYKKIIMLQTGRYHRRVEFINKVYHTDVSVSSQQLNSILSGIDYSQDGAIGEVYRQIENTMDAKIKQACGL